MIPQIKTLYLRLFDEFGSHKDNDPNGIWKFSQEEIDYMEQIKTPEDILNYTPSPDGKMQALAYDCALAMGMSRYDAMSAADDH